MVGPTAQLLEQLPSIPTSPLVNGDRLHPTDSWSDFSEDLSTMVIFHCCVRGGNTQVYNFRGYRQYRQISFCVSHFGCCFSLQRHLCVVYHDTNQLSCTYKVLNVRDTISFIF